MFSKIIKILYGLIKVIEQNLVVILLTIMVSNVAVGVFFRYVLNNSLPWTEELARYLMVWFAFIGVAIAFREEEHVNVSSIVNLFPIYIRNLIKIIAYSLVLFFLITLFSQSLNILKVVKIQTSPSMRIPMFYPYLSVTIGSLLMAIEVMRLISSSVAGLIKK